MKQLAGEVLAILAFSSGLALAVNVFSPAGIPVTRALPLTDLDPRYLTAEEARQRFDAGQSIFIDARKPDEFARGRIEGALNLAFENFADRYAEAAPWMPREREIVVYCGGADCAQSRGLADQLRAVGYPPEKIKIFRGGWKEWKARGWPAETGAGN